MKKKFFEFFNDIDLFGKEPELYYKGNYMKTSWVEEFLLFYI